MFIDYRSQVLAFYARKKAENVLSHRLVHATPANLKDECLAVCSIRYLRKDERALSTFFGKQDGREGYLLAIKRLDTDKFRPLVNFLRSRVTETDEKNVELLAWLIDFDQRPFELGKQYGEPKIGAAAPPAMETQVPAANADTQEAEKKEGGQDETKQVDMEEQEAGDVDGQESREAETEEQLWEPASVPQVFLHSGERVGRGGRLKRWLLIISCLVAMLAGAGVYLALKLNRDVRPEGCMYWAGDHYERISCNEKKANFLIIAYDEDRLEHFRKITTPDTITYKSIGRVWYIKLDGNLEYFMADGYHPIQIHRKLHPITEYIIRTYLHPIVSSPAIDGQVAR